MRMPSRLPLAVVALRADDDGDDDDDDDNDDDDDDIFLSRAID